MASVDIDLTLLLFYYSSVVLIDSCVSMSVPVLSSTGSENALENGPPSMIQLCNENRSVLSVSLRFFPSDIYMVIKYGAGSY